MRRGQKNAKGNRFGKKLADFPGAHASSTGLSGALKHAYDAAYEQLYRSDPKGFARETERIEGERAKERAFDELVSIVDGHVWKMIGMPGSASFDCVLCGASDSPFGPPDPNVSQPCPFEINLRVHGGARLMVSRNYQRPAKERA